MKKILSMLFGVLFAGLYVSTAFAEHYRAPTVDQERKEAIWSCTKIDDIYMIVTLIAATAEADKNIEWYLIWSKISEDLINQGRCTLSEITYVVDEILLTTIANYDLATYYIIKSGHRYIVTYDKVLNKRKK